MALQPFRSSAYWLFDRVLVYLMSCATNSICLRRMLPTQSKPCVQKLLITFTSHFPTSSLITNTSLWFLMHCWPINQISFDHLLCNLKHITFLIIHQHNVFKSLHLFFRFDQFFSCCLLFYIQVRYQWIFLVDALFTR